MDQIPQGAIPVDQFQAEAPATESNTQVPEGAIPVDQFESQEHKYSGVDQTIQAGLEGALRGVITKPGAAALETKLGLASPEGIRAREEEHPVAGGAGELTGLVGGSLLGTGEGAALTKAGEAAAEAVGLGNLAKDASYGAKVGSSIVKNAAEMAAYESQDEIGKAVLGDPNVGAQSAIANIGLAAALGGAGGAFFTGAVSPLWEATAGPKLEGFLSAIKSRANGESMLHLPEEITNDFKTLGVEPTAFQRADVSDHATAGKYIKDLMRAENETALAEKADLQQKVANSVVEPLGTNLEEMRVYDKNEAGHELKNEIVNTLKRDFSPIIEDLEQRKVENSALSSSQNDLERCRSDLIERGMNNKMIGRNSKYQKLYLDEADQILKHESVQDLDRHITELGRSARSFTQDPNVSGVQRDIRDALKQYREDSIRQSMIEKTGSVEAANDMVARQKYTSDQYARAERIREDLESHFNLKDSDNYRQFLKRIENDVTPEQIINKFSIKSNMDGARFLQENFPEIYQHVIRNEQKSLLKPAIMSAAKKGDLPIDVTRLNSIINEAKSGKNQYVSAVLPPEFIQRAEAAARILNATTKVKDSGTPAGLWSVLRGVGTSALATVGWMSGHGAGSSILLSELAAMAGKNIPEAYKLAFLKFLASDKPINAKGFQAAAEYFHAAQKGARVLSTASENVLKPGTRVITPRMMPTPMELQKLDKMVASNDPKETNQAIAAQSGHVDHYAPEHQTALTQASLQSLQYLKSIKPHPMKLSPLDREIPPTPAQNARYNRALEIAQQPAIVMQHVKDGTVQVNDLQDLKSMYPAVYQGLAQKLTSEIANRQHNEEQIPYKTRVGISLFLGQPLDSSMAPSAIISAQPKPKVPNQPQEGPKPKRSTSSLNKMSSNYRTPNQTAEHDRSNRD